MPITGEAKIVPPECYHITLAYLGERDADRLPALSSLLAECAALSAPFTLTADGAAFFKKPENATVYASLLPSDTLSRLCERLRVSLQAAGEAFDCSPFIPHITLARHASLNGLSHSLAGAKLAVPARFLVDSLTLFHSARTDGVLRYHPLRAATLNAPKEVNQ